MTWLPQAVKALQTLLLSHVPAPHSAVQVVMCENVATTVFFGVAVAHPPVAKRVVVSDMQVYVTSLAAAPVIGVHAVQSIPGSAGSFGATMHVAATLSESVVQVTLAAFGTTVHAMQAAVPVAYIPAGQVVAV